MSIGLWRMRLRSIYFLFDFFLLILCWVDEKNCWVKLSEAFVSYFWGDKCCLPVVSKFLDSTIHRQE